MNYTMDRKSIVFALTFLLIFSLGFPSPLFSELTQQKTIVTVVEGKVLCFEYPEGIPEDDVRIAAFVKMLSKYTCKIIVDDERYNAYIPQESRQKLKGRLKSGMLLLTVFNIRRIHGTSWDIVGIAEDIESGKKYEEGVVSAAEPEEVSDILDEALKEDSEPAAEKQEQETIIQEETFIDPVTPDPDIETDINEDEETEGEGEGPVIDEEELQEEENEPVVPPEPEPPAPTPTPGAPTAAILANPTSGAAPLTVNFDGSGSSDPDGSISSYSWDFGDGNSTTGATASNTYTAEGTYTATLTVTDNEGLSDSATVSITVSATALYFYVDPVNGNNSNDGSNLNPWKTITYALTQVTGGTINLTAGNFNTASGETFPLFMNTAVDLTGAGSSNSIIDAGGTGSVIVCLTVSDVTISGVGITGGSGHEFAPGNGVGGGIAASSSGNLIINNCLIYNNSSTAQGGAIALVGAPTTISNCTIANNSSATGGGIRVSGASNTVTIANCTIENNTASATGGGVSTSSGTTTTISNCTIQSNTAGTTGGGIATASASSTINVYNSTISSNTAITGGGMHCRASSTSTLEDSTLSSNSASSLYDGIFYEGTSLTVNRCILSSHTTNGFAIFASSSANDFTVTNALFNGNTGDISITGQSGASYTITNCTFADTTVSAAASGSIVFPAAGDGTLTVRNSIFTNSAGFGVTDLSAAGSRTINTNYFFNNTSGNYRLSSVGTLNTSAALNTVGSNNIGSDVAVALVFKGSQDWHLSSSNPSGATGVLDNPNVSNAPSVDLDGRSRDSTPDLGCYEFVTGDPPITCWAYDSVTRQALSAPVIGIYQANGTQVAVSTSNPHTFNVIPGRYFLAVAKDGYAFPSQIKAATTPGDHGDIFEAGSQPLTIDIPLDPDGWLYIEKTVNKKRAQIGEVVTYNIKVQNKHWFKSVSNVELVDEIVNGLKYVSGSTYSGRVKIADPVVSGHKAVFDIGTVNNNSTVNYSYQVRVGSAIPPGRYKAAAHTRKSTTLERNSNIDAVSVEIVEDPLFTRGTIIGKVFWDQNGNGIQDSSLVARLPAEALAKAGRSSLTEKGISGVKIYTEYGVVVTTDEDGKYHIADVPAETHLLKVDPSTLPPDVTFTTDNPYVVEITEGLLAKVNFGVKQTDPTEGERSREVKKQRSKDLLSKFFIVALGEGTVRNLNTSGNIDMVDKDDRYDDGVKVDGRLAFYLKGKVLGKYLIKACVDTERLPGGRYRSKDMFTNLDPYKYYPVYGDASDVDYSGMDTQDIAFVLIEWDESFAKWGNFHTSIPLYKRSLNGGIINYKSVGKTKFGDPWTIIKGFGATSRQKAAHDEFVGTGGSLYYLRHEDVIEGSEKIRVEVRHRISKTVLRTISLAEEMDYEIDYDSGRIILRKPLNGVQQSYSGSIVSNNMLMGEQVYLIVDYEYYNEGLSEQSWGARASQQLGPYLRVGGTYVQEQKPGDPYKIYGGDTTLKFNETTAINASYTHSQETQLSSTTSFDGGLTSIQQFDTFSNGKDGNAFNIEGRTRLFDNTDILLSYSRQDPYFSATDSISQQGSKKYIAEVISRLTEYLEAGVRHVTIKYLEEVTATQTFGDRDVHVTTGTLDYRKGKWDLRGEYQHQQVKNPATNYTYFGTVPYLNNDFLAARIGYQLFSWLHPYVRGQLTVRGKANNQGTVGADIKLWKRIFINIAETVGNLGNSTLLGVTARVNETTDVYTNLEIGNNLWLGRYTKTTYGQSCLLGPDSRAYVEEDYSSYQENIVRGTLLGYDKKIADTLALGLTYERSDLYQRGNAINRDSGSAALTYLNQECLEGLKAYTKLECRNDRGTNEVRQWFTENDFLWRLTSGLTISGRGNWGWSENRSLKTDLAEFYEVGTGFSLRPKYWDKLNILGKYCYLSNLPPASQWDFTETSESRRQIYALEGIYDLFRYLQLVAKAAYRRLKEKVGYRDWTDSDTYLYIARGNFRISNSDTEKPFMLRGWTVGLEYRILHNNQIEDSKKGWLIEMYKDIGNYLRFGIGYNFTDYDDDLRNADNWDSKGWFVRVNGKY